MSDTSDVDRPTETAPTQPVEPVETAGSVETTEPAEPTELTQTTEPVEGDLTERLGMSAGSAEPASPVGGYLPPTSPPLLATASDGAGAAARSGPSVPTVLWGLLLAAVAAGAIVHQVSDVDINFTAAVPVALLAIGAALVIWGVAGLAHRRR